ncbi:MAG: HIT family protein [Caulobacterales bacterium]|nr:HIT family protein [Caulobacterales bacterium]
MALEGRYDADNIFAKILRGEIPCHTVFEDETALAFMDLFPQSEGHTLIVPRTPARNLFDLPPEALSALIVRVQQVAHAVRAAFEPDGVVVTQFNGAPAGQTVFHVHFHVIPVYEGRPTGRHADGGQADAEVLSAHAAKIAAALA